MSFFRMICVVERNYVNEFMDKLGDFNFKKVHENNQCELFYIEGRYFPKINQKKTLLLGIDGRNTTWVKQGREELSKNFDAKIDLCVGFSVATEGYLKLKKKKEFKDCLKALCNSSGEGFYPDEDIDKQWMRIDIALCAGIVEGNLDDDGDFFGPAAYAKASWDVEVMRTETIRITVNDAEVLFDGDEIVF
jgi:hypothetical protein